MENVSRRIDNTIQCSFSETFGIETDKIPDLKKFILALDNERILHMIKNRNDGKQVIFFSNRDKEKVSNIFYSDNRDKSVKKHHTR